MEPNGRKCFFLSTHHPFIHPSILMVHKGAAGVCWVSQPSFLVVYSLSLSLSLGNAATIILEKGS
jgi:hypothetical protein